MTNAEKWLKEGVDAIDFVEEFNDFCAMQTNNQASSVRLAQFLSRAIKPTLTEDERAILRNIDTMIFKKIGRDSNEDIYLLYSVDRGEPPETEAFWYFNHLFQFIKERRRILN